jgi:nucleoside-diphosphate-sugar epimerase
MVDFLIEKNADFRAVVHRTPLEKKVETVYADITRPEDIEKCVRDVDVIFHLAFPMSHLTYSLPYFNASQPKTSQKQRARQA